MTVCSATQLVASHVMASMQAGVACSCCCVSQTHGRNNSTSKRSLRSVPHALCKLVHVQVFGIDTHIDVIPHHGGTGVCAAVVEAQLCR